MLSLRLDRREFVSVRKRVWNSRRNGRQEAWVVDYADQQGKRRLKTFALKREADAFAASSRIEVGQGTHIADSASVTVKQAGDLWLETSRGVGLEVTSVEMYEQHLRL